MARYVTVRLTVAQAQAASNAADLIRDQLDADGRKREAALYARASAALDQVGAWRRPEVARVDAPDAYEPRRIPRRAV